MGKCHTKGIVFLVTFIMLLNLTGAWVVQAAKELPDLVITSVSLNNPYFERGDNVGVKVTIKNIGKAPTNGEWIGVGVTFEKQDTRYKGIMDILQPGDIAVVEFDSFKMKTEVVRYTCLVDSSNTVTEIDKTNNEIKGIIKSHRPDGDLVVESIKLVDEMTQPGDAAAFEIVIANDGILDMEYQNIEVIFELNGEKQYLQDVQGLISKGEFTLITKPINVKDKIIFPKATVNYNKKISESDYNNNTFETRINLIETAQYNWDTVRLGGGGFVTGGVIHPTVPDLMYIRTDVGGAYRLDADNRRWVPITDWVGIKDNNFYGIHGVAVDSLNPDTVYICAGQNSTRQQIAWNMKLQPCDVLKSTDGGKTFARTNLNIDFDTNALRRWLGESIAVDPNNSNIVYVGGIFDGLWKSTNATSSTMKWEQVNLPDFTPSAVLSKVGGIRSIVFDKNSVKNSITQKIYVTICDVGIYCTEDGGVSWRLMKGGPTTPARLSIADNGTLYASTEKEGVKSYKDGIWTDITPDSEVKSYSGISVNPFDENQLVAAEFKSAFRTGIYFSSNGGKTWKNIRSDAIGNADVDWWGGEKFGAAVAWISFDPHHQGRVWFSDWYGVWYTDDITETKTVWQSLEPGHEETVTFGMATPKEGARLLTVVGDNDGTRHTDIYEYPKMQFRKPPMSDGNGIDVCENDPNIVVRVGGYSAGKRGDGGYSLDNGITWNAFPDYPKNENGVKKPNGRVVVASDKNANGIPTIMVVPISSRPYRSEDYGKTWTEIMTLPSGGVSAYWTSNLPAAADMCDKNLFYYYSREGVMYVSKDGAKTFEKAGNLPASVSSDFVRPAPNMKGEVWFSAAGQGLYRSSDSGATFEKLPNVQSALLMGWGKEAPGSEFPTAYVYGRVYNTDGIFRSTDMGKTWVKINTSHEALGCRPGSIAGDRQTFGIVYIGTGGRGFYSGVPADVDISKPQIILNCENGIQREDTYKLIGRVNESAAVTYRIDDSEETVVQTDGNFRFNESIPLTEGKHVITIGAVDSSGNVAYEKTIDVTCDPKFISIRLDQEDSINLDDETVISGAVNVISADGTVDINGTKVYVNKATKRFETKIPLNDGINRFVVTAKDQDGNTGTKELLINKDVFPPEIELSPFETEINDNVVIVKGCVNETASVVIGTSKVFVDSTNDYTFKIPVVLKNGLNKIEIKATDLVNLQAVKTVDIASAMTFEQTDSVVVGKAGSMGIDGSFDEAEWNFNNVISKITMGESDNVAKFALLGDQDNLYIALKVYDNNVFEKISSNVTENDSFEVYIDAFNTKSEKYAGGVNQIIVGLDGYINATTGQLKGAVTKSKITDYGYDTEILIPWSSIEIKPKNGYVFGFDISINDDDKGSGRDGVVAWAGTDNNWKSAKNFGTAYIFGK